MNAEPVTNEQPAQVGALSRPPAPLQWNPAPPGAMVMSKQAAGSQQETLAQLPTARTPFSTGLSWQQRATSPDPPLQPSLVELALPHPSTKRTSVPGMACAGSMCVWPRPDTRGDPCLQDLQLSGASSILQWGQSTSQLGQMPRLISH